jgi:hypothetical protein
MGFMRGIKFKYSRKWAETLSKNILPGLALGYRVQSLFNVTARPVFTVAELRISNS